jgi:hypothetical protein
MWRRNAWIAALIGAATPGIAQAHLVNTGFGPFYDGITHLFMAPQDVLAAAAIAVLAGLRGPRFGRWVLLVLPAAWLAGAGPLVGPHVPAALAMPLGLIAAGGLAASDARISVHWVVGLAALLGLLHGCTNGADLATDGLGADALAGIAFAVFCVVALLAGQVATLEGGWTRVAGRVAGSWIAAIGLFMLGWALRPESLSALPGGIN